MRQPESCWGLALLDGAWLSILIQASEHRVPLSTDLRRIVGLHRFDQAQAASTTPSSTGWDETRRVKRNENETVSVMSSKPDHLIVENEKTKTLSGNIGLRVLF